MWWGVQGLQEKSVPDDVSKAKAAHSQQTWGPAGVSMVGGPHLDDDEGKNSGVLRR